MKRSRLESGFLEHGDDPLRVAELVRDAKRRPGCEIWRFEMTDALAMGSGSVVEYADVLAIRWDGSSSYTDEPSLTVRVYDYQRRFSKMATVSGDGGANGLAIRFPDRPAEFELLTMETPGPFLAQLDSDLTQAMGSVYVKSPTVLGGYDVFGENYVDQHGSRILATNPAGGGNFAANWWSGGEGDRVLCVWDMAASHYKIWGCEPNNHGYQTLDVVTDLTIDFVGQSYTYHTRQIELPPWVTIEAAPGTEHP